MAIDLELTDRMRVALLAILDGDDSNLAEKRMMGGVCFMFRGNMVCGADKPKDGPPRFMFRTGKDNPAGEALPGGQPMVMGERLMRGFYFVEGQTCHDALLNRWLRVALDHAMSLPAK